MTERQEFSLAFGMEFGPSEYGQISRCPVFSRLSTLTKVLRYLSWKLDVATQVFTAFFACLRALPVLRSVCEEDICSFVFLLCDNSFPFQCYKYKCTVIPFSNKLNRIAVNHVKFFYYSIILFSILKLLGGMTSKYHKKASMLF